MSTIGERLRKFGLNKYGSIKEFAIALGMSSPALQQYLSSRREPGTPILERLADIGCDLQWLITGETFHKSNPQKKIIEFRVEATVAAGNADYTDLTGSYESETIEFDPDKHFFVIIDNKNGDSMYPLLKPGDSVLVENNPAIRIKEGDFVLAKWNKKGAIKIYSVQGNNIILSSVNLNAPPIILPKIEVKCHRVKLIKKK